jgi:pyridoxine 4-dehydrogenase
MARQTSLGGSFKLPNTSITLNRIGYGAMQLAGAQVWGRPRDVEGAVAVLREAVASGVNHIDTSDFYGPHVTNQIIKKALHPYPDGLVIVTKVGARRVPDKSWLHALSRPELMDAVHDNLRNLGLDRLDVVNLRVGGVMGPSEGSIAEPLTVLAELKRQGLIRHLGLSNVYPAQLAEAQKLPRSSACRTSTTWRTGTMMASSMTSPGKA